MKKSKKTQHRTYDHYIAITSNSTVKYLTGAEACNICDPANDPHLEIVVGFDDGEEATLGTVLKNEHRPKEIGKVVDVEALQQSILDAFLEHC